MSFPPGVAANSGLAHRPPQGTSCVLGRPPPHPHASVPLGREGRDTRGTQDERRADVRWTRGQEGFPGEADSRGQNSGGPLWRLSWAPVLPCKPGAGAPSAHSVAHSTCHTQASLGASLTPLSLLLQSQIGPWGFGPNADILHTYWTRTRSHRATHSHVHAVDESPQFPKCHHGHSAKQKHTLPFTVPGLLSCPPPISCPPVRQGAGWGGTGGRCQCPQSHRWTFLAWVRSQKLPPSRSLSWLSSRLTQCPRVGQLD